MSRIFAEIGIANVSGRFFIPAFHTQSWRVGSAGAIRAPVQNVRRQKWSHDRRGQPQLTIGSCFSHSFSIFHEWIMNEHDPLNPLNQVPALPFPKYSEGHGNQLRALPTCAGQPLPFLPPEATVMPRWYWNRYRRYTTAFCLVIFITWCLQWLRPIIFRLWNTWSDSLAALLDSLPKAFVSDCVSFCFDGFVSQTILTTWSFILGSVHTSHNMHTPMIYNSNRQSSPVSQSPYRHRPRMGPSGHSIGARHQGLQAVSLPWDSLVWHGTRA